MSLKEGNYHNIQIELRASASLCSIYIFLAKIFGSKFEMMHDLNLGKFLYSNYNLKNKERKQQEIRENRKATEVQETPQSRIPRVS